LKVDRGPQLKTPNDCLAKTQLHAKSKDDVYGVMPGQCPNVKEEGYPSGEAFD